MPASIATGDRALAAGLCLIALAAPRLPAQCGTQWVPGQGVPGIGGTAQAVTQWDPDGAGPAPSVVVCGGNLWLAGSVVVSGIAMYDPTSGAWSPLGSGIDATGTVLALTTLPNGDLVAGGQFTTAGGVVANSIARWDGLSWSPLGTGMNGGASMVSSLTTLPNGDLVAGGSFTTAGGVVANNVARWDGVSWSPLGTGMAGGSNPLVAALAALPNGDLVAGGVFTTAGGVAADNIARWDGVSWSPLGAGMVGGFFPAVWALATLANGDVVAGGQFTTAGGVAANHVARWDGLSWSPLGPGFAGPVGIPAVVTRVFALTALPSGDVVASGVFATAGVAAANNIARWDGATWSPLGPGINVNYPYGGLFALAALANGDLVAGGSFQWAGTGPARGIARWDGTSWSALGAGMDSFVYAMTALSNGDVVVGGVFTMAGGVTANRIARWNGTAWSPLGTGAVGSVYALTTLANGDVVAGGQIWTAGGVAANNIARWDGTSWSALGAGMGPIFGTSQVNALTTLPNGDLVAGGSFTMAGGVAANRIARWDGTAWHPFGTGVDGEVLALKALPNGDLVAGGTFFFAGGLPARMIARWNGTSWSPLGTGMTASVATLTTLPNGDLVAGGAFGTAGGVVASRIARWNGTAWSPLGTGGLINGWIRALVTLPNGDVAAAGEFTTAGGVAANYIARWNGTTWSPFGAGLEGWVAAMTAQPNGDLAVGGWFALAGGNVSAYFARLTTTCPAIVVAQGAGCTGSGGPNVLAATALPWIGATFRARATGMPATGLVVAATGFTTVSLPLASVLPQGQAGCSLLVMPDLLDMLLPAVGAADSQLALPNTPSLVGQSFHHQMVPFELDASSAITAVTSTNALTATVGAF